jgi:hypothetical protein
MIPISLRNKAKKLGIRVTKDVDGKRVKLTENDIKKLIFTVMRNKASNTKKFIRICKNVLVTASPNNNRRVTRSSFQAPPPPPPPAPRKPVINAKRAKLMSELKATLKKRGMTK